MASKELLSVRIPSELMAEINALSGKTGRDKTAIATELLQRGLEVLADKPVKTANYVTVEEMAELEQRLLAVIEKK